jgi:phosphohistidine phosphatase
MRLWVVRHAKSSWSEPVSDHERGLNKRGRRDAPRMSAWLAAQDLPPTRILSSDAVRTRLTTEHLQDALGLANAAIGYLPELYLGATRDMLAAVQTLPDDCESAAVVGHNPTVTQFANTLLDRARIDDMPTLAIAGIDLPAPWRSVAPGGGRLVAFATPKQLSSS